MDSLQQTQNLISIYNTTMDFPPNPNMQHQKSTLISMKLCTVSIYKSFGRNSGEEAPRAESPEGGTGTPALTTKTSCPCEARGLETGLGPRVGIV